MIRAEVERLPPVHRKVVKVSDEEMKDFLRMRLQPEMTNELPPVERRKQLREVFHISRNELAEKMGVSLAAIGSWETGRNEPRGDARKRYLAFCKAAEEVLREAEGGTSDGATTEEE